MLKNNVISHLYEQITRSLVRIYLGLDSHKANLRVWVALKFSDPIKALIEGRMKERGKEKRAMKSRMEKGRVSDEAQLCSFFSLLHPLH